MPPRARCLWEGHHDPSCQGRQLYFERNNNNNNNNNNSTAVYTTAHPREHFRGGCLQEDGVHVQLWRDLHFLLQALRWQARLLRWTGKNTLDKGDHWMAFVVMFIFVLSCMLGNISFIVGWATLWWWLQSHWFQVNLKKIWFERDVLQHFQRHYPDATMEPASTSPSAATPSLTALTSRTSSTAPPPAGE